jgi:hypothetical protein
MRVLAHQRVFEPHVVRGGLMLAVGLFSLEVGYWLRASLGIVRRDVDEDAGDAFGRGGRPREEGEGEDVDCVLRAREDASAA